MNNEERVATIIVDSSVWIDYFNGEKTAETDLLDELLSTELIIIGDIILGEVLQGFRKDKDFDAAHNALNNFQQVCMLNPQLAVQSAKNFRSLRKRGITVRKTIDCFIATYCIERGKRLLHSDRDFDPFEEFLGLSVVR
jgi:predicted nucleic acid-binding protein